MKKITKVNKLKAILDGQRVPASDSEMSFFEAEVDNHPQLLSLASIHNPKCTGLKDRYIAFIKASRFAESTHG